MNIEQDFNPAIKYMRYDWLKYVFAFKKNFDGDRNSKDSKQVQEIDLKRLFGLIVKMYEKENDAYSLTKREIEKCC